jgi:hypothetical protein
MRPYKLDNISIVHHDFPPARTLAGSMEKHPNFPSGPRGIGERAGHVNESMSERVSAGVGLQLHQDRIVNF